MPSLRHFSFAAPLLLVLAAAPLAAQDSAPLAPGAGCSSETTTVRCPGDRPQLQGEQGVQPLLSPGTDDWEYDIGTVEYSVEDGENLVLDGGVVIRQGERELSAERVEVTSEGRRFEVQGEVTYRDPALVVEAGTGDFEGGAASFEDVRFELPERPARGGADSLSVDRNGILRLEGVEYTTCPPEHDDWRIVADSVEINSARSSGIARDARVEFFGVPLLRLPVISFPVGNARKTGLLFPSIGSSTRGGVELAVPWYWNIAPQQDLTLTPTWYSNRGFDFGGEYRYLTRRSRGQVSGNLLPGDDRSGDTRSRLKVQSVTDLPREWRLSIDAENVSDPRYLEDFARGTNDASTTFLPRSALLAYRNDQVELGVLWRNFQTLYSDLPQTDRPHTELPRVFASGDWQLPGAFPLVYGADIEAANFRHGEDVQGWRINAMPHLALDYAGAGWFVRPGAALASTHYSLSDLAPGADNSPSRTLPQLSLDAGLLFERGGGRQGQRRVTLEPRVKYLYVPFQDQDGLPVFDTWEPSLNWVQLFRDSRYVGIDRISDANQISTGVTAQLFGNDTGQRFVSATLGQTWYLRSPRVLLPDEPEDPGNTSDLIAEVELSALRNWNVSTGWQWDPQGQRTERAEVRLQYRPTPQRVVNVGYRFQRDRMEQAEFSAAWPLTDTWRLYGRSQYSLRDNKFIENFAGFEYSSCCWSVRAVAREYVGRRSGERDRSIYLQLELKGLSNVGLAADAFLERAIRGYSTRQRRPAP